MASAGIQFVASANASSVAKGASVMQAASDGAPVDFAALLFAAHAAPISSGLADLSALGLGLGDDNSKGSEKSDDVEGAPDLALLLGGLVLPQDGQTSKPASSSEPLETAATDAPTADIPSGKRPALFAGADTSDAGKLGELADRDGKGVQAANLAEAVENLPATNNGNHFGHLIGNHGVGSAAQPQGGAPAASVHVATAVHDPQWGQDFSQRVVWMARSEMQSAHLTLNPANLGPIEVTLNLGAEQATAMFSSPHGEVREALEAALPRLREMLAGAGISLGDAQVNAQTQRDMAQSHSPGQRQGAPGNPSGAILGADNAVNTREGPKIRVGLGLIDTFA